MTSSQPTASGAVFMVVNTYAPHDSRVIFSATSLRKLGYNVFLVGAARQRTGDVPVRQHVDGVDVFITPMMTARGFGAVLRALGHLLRGNPGATTYASPYPRSDLLSVLFFNLWLLRLGLGRQIDVVHCHDLSPLPGAWLLARLKRAKIIYDCHENAPTMYVGRKGHLVTWMERRLLSRVDLVISAGERLATALRERGARQVVHIGNWKRLADYEVAPEHLEATRTQFDLCAEDVVLTYLGTLDPTRELQPLIEAVATDPHTRLIIGGRGLLQDEVIAVAKQHPNIHWLGWVDLADVPRYTHLAHALYCCLDVKTFTEENYYAPAANKLFEAFAAGVPLIARRGVNEIGDVLEQTGAGILVDDVEPATLHAVFAQLRDPATRADLQARAHAARQQYHWGIAEDRLRDVYGELVGVR